MFGECVQVRVHVRGECVWVRVHVRGVCLGEGACSGSVFG